jgi:CRISPR/Cas system CSM-associated protein Csm3 (group 7 of RAMP superfamily)
MVAKGAGTLLRNKPYAFVPLLPVRPEDRREIVPHNRIDCHRLTGRLVLELEVITPLHIGSGSYRLIDGQLVQAFLRRGETPVIPGSSLKGAVRSLAEAASRSCLPQPPGKNCSRLQNAFPHGSRTPCSAKAACITCRLFGFVQGKKGYRGRVVFGEFTPCGEAKLAVEKLPALEQPFRDYPRKPENRGCGNERLYYCRFYEAVACNGPAHCPDCTKGEWLEWQKSLKGQLPSPAFRGRKFYLQGNPRVGKQPCEVVVPGSRFRGEVTFQNLDREELALLCFALGLDDEMRLGLGYGKPAYMGTVQVHLQEARWYARGYLELAAPGLDPVKLARDYGREDPEIAANVKLLREILSGRRRGPAWGAGGY